MTSASDAPKKDAPESAPKQSAPQGSAPKQSGTHAAVRPPSGQWQVNIAGQDVVPMSYAQIITGWRSGKLSGQALDRKSVV